MSLEALKESMLLSARQLSQQVSPENANSHNKQIIDALLRHWAVAVPNIFRPTSVNLNPVFDEQACIDALIAPLEWYITGTDNPKELLEKLKKVCPPPELCGKVFKGGEPVYNCRDCGMDGTCVLCVDCFKNSEHKNHRYRICTSSSGLCDCGDNEAWTAHPTCTLHHKTLNNDAFVSMLGNIMTSIEFEHLLSRLKLIFQIVLDYCYIILKWPKTELPLELQVPEELKPKPNDNDEEGRRKAENTKNYVAVLYNDETHTYEHVIYALSKSIRCDSKLATDYATAVDREGRCIICLDEEAKCQQVANQISDITKKSSDRSLEVKVTHTDVHAHQTFATRLITWMSSILPICEQFRTIFAGHLYTGKHSSPVIRFVEDDVVAVSLVEKLMLSDTFFWKAIRVQWHQLFMAGLLLDMDPKKQFARLFTRNYPAMIQDYMRDDHEHRVSILCLSVQIYTVPSIVGMLIEQENIIELLVNTFIQLNHSFHVPQGKFKFDSLHNLFSFRRSYQLLSDLSYIISKPPDVWTDRMREAFCAGVEAFVKLIKRMQLMDSIVRQVNQHIEYEPGWETGINFQMKLAPIMKSMVEWCATDEQVYIRALNISLEWFRLSFNSANRNTHQLQKHAAGHSAYCWDYDVSRREVSIHMPLIRFVGALLVHSGKFGVIYAEDSRLISKRPTPECLIELPLRTQVMIGQFRAGMWRRNGYSLINQVLFYFNVRLRDEMFDRDLMMLQVGAAMIESNEYLIHLLNKFNLMFLLDETNQHQRPTNDELIRQTNTVIEEFFRLIYIILVERYVPGLGAVTFEDCVRREAIQWLCKDSMSNSDLISHLSVSESDMNVEELILQVAEFRKPANPTKHGKYVLKDEYYRDFNPFFYHYNRTDQSASFEAQLRRRKNNKEKYVCCPPPPLPDFVDHFRSINNLLLSDVMLALIKTILEKTCDLNDNLFSDTQFQQVLYICGIALQEEMKHPREFKFSVKCVDHGIVQLLERCNSRHILPRIEMHKDLLTWLFDKFKEVFQMQASATVIQMDTVMADTDHSAATAKEPAQLSEAQLKEEEDMKAKRREMANARKNRILAQMNAMQKTFMQENAEYFKSEFPETNSLAESANSNAGSMMDICPSTPSGVAIGVNQDARTASSTASFTDSDFFTCILCLEQHNINSADRFLVLGAFVQKSTVLSQNRSHKAWMQAGPIPGLYELKGNESLKNVCFVESDLNYGPHMNTCTHYMHSDCFEKYLEMVLMQERRRATGRHPRVSYDINKGEFLCPLCECLCNIAVPIVPQVTIKANTIKTDIPMEKFLSGLHSVVTDSGCDGSTGWLDSHKYNETYSGYKKPFNELIQFLPSDIRQFFQDLQEEYMANLQVDTVAEAELSRVTSRRKLMLDCTKTAYIKIFGTTQLSSFSPMNPDPLQSIYWSIAYSIHSLERQLRTERTTFAETIDTRPYHCLKALVSLVRGQMCNYSFSVPRQLFLYLSNYLLVQTFYQSSPFSILDVDAFSLLVTLLSTSGSLFVDQDNTHDTKKFAILLGNSVDKNLIELIFTFHLVQVILTSLTDTLLEEPMEVDESSSFSEDQNLVQFIMDVLTAAGHHFTVSQVTANGARLTASVRSKLLPFLRCVAIYAHFLTDVKLPKRLLEAGLPDKSPPGNSTNQSTTVIHGRLSVSEEYEVLCHYLGIPSTFSFLGITYLRGVALFWPRHTRIRNMFVSGAAGEGTSSQLSPQHLNRTVLKPEFCHLMQPHRVNRLQQLPHDYSDLINSLARFTCPNSNAEESRYPTMCLVCGEILCSQNYCCQKKLKREMIGACTYHAQFCGAGTGLFLRIRDCKILLLATRGRGCYLPSPYVDKFGETDQGLVRGDPLFLSESAYENLYKLWLRHGIPEQIVHLLESHSQLTATNWNMM